MGLRHWDSGLRYWDCGLRYRDVRLGLGEGVSRQRLEVRRRWLSRMGHRMKLKVNDWLVCANGKMGTCVRASMGNKRLHWRWECRPQRQGLGHLVW